LKKTINFDEHFGAQLTKLILYSESIDSTQFYYPVFVKVPDLYIIIRDMSKRYDDLKKIWTIVKRKRLRREHHLRANDPA